MLVILLNCVTLGMFHPCEDIDCDSERCKILEVRLSDASWEPRSAHSWIKGRRKIITLSNYFSDCYDVCCLHLDLLQRLNSSIQLLLP